MKTFNLINFLLSTVILTFYFLLLTFNCAAQLDTIHLIPPLHAEEPVTFGSPPIDDHYIYLSTPITTPFIVTIKDGSGAILATPSISKNNPFVYFVGNGQTSGSPLFVRRDSLNLVLKNKGIKLRASQPFFANLRVKGGGVFQADWATAKGFNALGLEFRLGGFPQFVLGSNAGNPRNFVAGIMATEDSTTITISDINPGVLFSGVPNISPVFPITIQLNKGNTYIISGRTMVGSPTANLDGFIGGLIQANKPIALNNGNMNGTIHPTNTNNQDIGIDLSIPVERLGKEYILVEGNGNTVVERPIIIAHKDSTKIFVNGSSTPISIINAGDYFLIPNINYQGINHHNMFVRTSQPVYMYQALAATNGPSNNDGGLVLIPPFNCFLPDSIDEIPFIDSIGNTAYSTILLIITELGATVQVNGVPQSNPEPVLGTNMQTYKTTTFTGNVKITSTSGVTVSVLGNASPAGYAGYFSGFSSIPLASDFTYTDTCFSSPTSFNANFDVQFPSDSIIWNFGNPASGSNNFANTNNPTHIFTSPGTYTIQMIVFRCQNDTITKQITILPTATFTQNPVICQGDSIIINGNVYTTIGNFIDTLTTANGCDSIVTTNLTVNPAISIVQNFNECQGFSVIVGSNIYNTTGNFIDTLTATSGCDSIVTTNLTITTPIVTNQAFNECQGFSVTVGTNTYTTSGIYTDVMNGCDTVITDLTINPPPTLTLIKVDDNCGGNTGSITALVTTTNPPVTYNWNTGDNDSVISNLPVGTYNLTINDASGCVNSDTINVLDLEIECDFFIFIPNVFTPNGDGQNDEFLIHLKGLKFINLEIYNRWGLKLFETSDISQGWDGRTNSGSEVSDGTYFYILNYKNNDKRQVENGTLTLLR